MSCRSSTLVAIRCSTDPSTRSLGSGFMSKQDDSLQSRLPSPRDTPGVINASKNENEETSRTTVAGVNSKNSKQVTKLPFTKTLRSEQESTHHNLDKDVSILPNDSKSSPINFQPVPSLSPSTPQNTTKPEILDLFDSPMDWRNSNTRPAWEEVQNLRAVVWDLRSQIHQMRVSLREKQDIKAEADDNLFRRITYMTARGLDLKEPSSNSNSGQRSLTQLMDDCQEARNEYGPLEDDCIRLEGRLSQEEFRLARLEDRFFDQLNPGQEHIARLSQISVPSEEPSPTASAASIDNDFEASEYHPLVMSYLSKVGDLDLIQERLDEFRDEKAALEAERVSRQRFGLTLDPDDQGWLDDSEAEYRDMNDQIRLLERETERLKQICLSKNLIDEDGEPTSFQQQEEACFRDEQSVASRNMKSEYVKYPLLLPCNFRKKHETSEMLEPTPDIGSGIAIRVNEWILQKLRISPLEVLLLASTSEYIYGSIMQDWQIQVLKLWYDDETTQRGLDQEHPTLLVSHESSMSTRHPDDVSVSSELSLEHTKASLLVRLAPPNHPPSAISIGGAGRSP